MTSVGLLEESTFLKCHRGIASAWIAQRPLTPESQSLTSDLEDYLQRVDAMLLALGEPKPGEIIIRYEFPKIPRVPSTSYPGHIDWGDRITKIIWTNWTTVPEIICAPVPRFVISLEPSTIAFKTSYTQENHVYEILQRGHGGAELKTSYKLECPLIHDVHEEGFWTKTVGDKTVRQDASAESGQDAASATSRPQSTKRLKLKDVVRQVMSRMRETGAFQGQSSDGERFMRPSEYPSTWFPYQMTRLSQDVGFSPESNFTSPASFFSTGSSASFVTARTAYNSPAYVLSTACGPMKMCEPIVEEPAQATSSLERLGKEYESVLEKQGLILPFDRELNWSGKGQHVQFTPTEVVPLRLMHPIGRSITSQVDKVLCKRVALARKMMRCSRQWTVTNALQEVYHLQHLRHRHVVQLVGTYLQGRIFAILMYPVADEDLGHFLQRIVDRTLHNSVQGWGSQGVAESIRRQRTFTARAMACLASTMRFVHGNTTKHMDIKPQNILVRAPTKYPWSYEVYLADFGLSRSFAEQGYSQTDGPTARTPRYCAPEVWASEARGRASDIFSLGCVYAEILTVYAGKDLFDFSDHRSGEGETDAFHANLDRVASWVSDLPSASQDDRIDRIPASVCALVCSMISHDPAKRPTASQLDHFFASADVESPFRKLKNCCDAGPEPYAAYVV